MRTEKEIREKIQQIIDYVNANKRNLDERDLTIHRYRIIDLKWMLGEKGYGIKLP